MIQDSIAGCRLGWKAEDGIDRTLLGDDERCLGTGWHNTVGNGMLGREEHGLDAAGVGAADQTCVRPGARFTPCHVCVQ